MTLIFSETLNLRATEQPAQLQVLMAQPTRNQNGFGATSKKSMRESMPTIAAFVDELRQVFGTETINRSIKAGMAGQPGKFWASENGVEVGTR